MSGECSSCQYKNETASDEHCAKCIEEAQDKLELQKRDYINEVQTD